MRRFAIGSFVAFLTHEDRASILPTFAIALVPLVGAVGASVDYSQANQVRSSLQSTLDAAILAAVRDGTSSWNSTANDFFNANLQVQGISVQSPSFTKADTGTVSGSVSAVVPTTFLGVVGVSSVAVTVHSSAGLSNSTAAQYCVLALNKTAQPGLRLTGNATIDIKAPQCILQVNSNATGAVNMNGNASITSAHNCFVGSTVKVGNATITPPPDAMCKPVPDPFAGYTAKPAVGPCTVTNYSVSGHTTVELQPGVYCGGMQFSGQVNVTFKPGVYIIKDGPLQASGGASFTGDDVAFYLTGSGAAVNLSGQASVHLVARKTGNLKGFVFFLEPSGPSGLAATSSQLSGSSDLYFEGVIYLPGQLVNITGSAEVDSPSPYTSFIADRIDINGNGTLTINNDPSKTTVPVPSELQVSLGGQPILLQ